MNKLILIFSAIVVIICSSCAKNIHVNYRETETTTGKVIIKPSSPTWGTYITINDSLIVDKKNVKSLTITNVPDGEYKIHYTANNTWYREELKSEITLNIQKGKETTKLVEVPPYSTGYWIYISIIAIAPWFSLLLI